MDNKFRFGEVKKKMIALKHELPIVLANQAQNYFVKSWNNQAWDGSTWKIPQRKIEGTTEYKYPKLKGLGRRTRATLVKTGALRRAVSNSVRSKTFESIRLLVDLPYADRHNEGKDGMPRRTFMKDSMLLRGQQRKKINEFIKNLFK